MSTFQLYRLYNWCGVAAIALFALGFLFAHFIPPLSPALTQDEVVRIYQEHSVAIRVGMLMTMISGMFMAPFVGLISAQLRRMNGTNPAVVYAQIVAGTTNTMFFFIPAILFIVTAYRPERSPELTFMMNDLSWIIAVLPWPPAFMQNCIIGMAILNDHGEKPLFPRWLGFFNFWVAIGFLPGGLLPFFHGGPLAWSGVLVFWLAGSVFILWFIVMVVMLFKAIRRQELEAAA